jgi:transposase-like protein
MSCSKGDEIMECKKCKSIQYVKNGIVRGMQRYRCKSCSYNFTSTPQRRKPKAMKALAILLYTLGNASFAMIGRLLKVSNVAVLKWVRKEAKSLERPDVPSDLKVVQIDEMWH